jgi:hypothetical protein
MRVRGFNPILESPTADREKNEVISSRDAMWMLEVRELLIKLHAPTGRIQKFR